MFEDNFIHAEDYLAALERQEEAEELRMREAEMEMGAISKLAWKSERWFEEHPCLFAILLYMLFGLFFSTLTLLAVLL